MSERPSQGMSMRVFVPLLIIAITLLVQIFYQNSALRRERELLEIQWAQQRATLEESEKLRNQLESIAGATAILAEQGNENAIRIRDQLREQGIAIQPPK